MNDVTKITERGINSDGNFVFLPYDAKAPIVEAGRRTIKLMYKVNTQTKKAAGVNSCLLVSPITSEDLTEEIKTKLVPHIINMLEVEQDKLVRTAHLAGDNSVSNESINITSIISSLETVRSSTRMNKEVITAWFESNMKDTLTVLFADKLGVSEVPTTEDEADINRFLDVYQNKFNGLASNLVNYQKEEAVKLLEAVTKCEVSKETDLVSAKIIEKLDKMVNPLDKGELLDLL